MPDWFWTGFHVYWLAITTAICWRWWSKPASFPRLAMLALGSAALLANILFLYTDVVSPAAWQ